MPDCCNFTRQRLANRIATIFLLQCLLLAALIGGVLPDAGLSAVVEMLGTGQMILAMILIGALLSLPLFMIPFGEPVQEFRHATHRPLADAQVDLILDILLPAAQNAAQLRGAGIRLVADPGTIRTLHNLGETCRQQNQASRAAGIDIVAGNLFPEADVSRRIHPGHCQTCHLKESS